MSELDGSASSRRKAPSGRVCLPTQPTETSSFIKGVKSSKTSPRKISADDMAGANLLLGVPFFIHFPIAAAVFFFRSKGGFFWFFLFSSFFLGFHPPPGFGGGL